MVELNREYRIVRSVDAHAVGTMVGELFGLHWALHGPLQVVVVDGVPFYIQAMVRAVSVEDIEDIEEWATRLAEDISKGDD